MQHEPRREPAPRPLPLFLELVREVGVGNPELARSALAGLRAYEVAERGPSRAPMPKAALVGGASLRDHGGTGPVAILIPSLINPQRILDLDRQCSLAEAVKAMGRRVLLLDWGAATERTGHSVSSHVESILVPLLRQIAEPAALIGYCLGGTMAIAAANLVPVERVITIASPWHFSAYPDRSRAALQSLWSQSKAPASLLGVLPIEVLQAAFWSLDPLRMVSKFADFAKLDPGSAKARRFVALEDWANDGEPLPFAAAEELIERMFGADLPGSGNWQVGGQMVIESLPIPVLNLTARHDSIAPAATAPSGRSLQIPAGHVGMVVGSASHSLHEALAEMLGSSDG